jgi:hypothetical protein
VPGCEEAVLKLLVRGTIPYRSLYKEGPKNLNDFHSIERIIATCKQQLKIER